MKTVATGEGFLTFPVMGQDERGNHLSPFLGFEEENSNGSGRRKRKCRVEVL